MKKFLFMIFLYLTFFGCATNRIHQATVDDMIEWTWEAYHAHAYYYWHPKYTNKWTGSIEWHEAWMDRFLTIIDFLKKQKSRNE